TYGEHMERAIILIKVDPRIEKQVLDEIRTLRGVKEAHYLYGPYDIGAKIEVKTLEDLEDLVLNRIRDIYGVVTTMTCYIAEEG
ncbi:Lrp/AsnC family transcriptional regulator, partial [archaeon]